jgi:hypothetical protein
MAHKRRNYRRAAKSLSVIFGIIYASIGLFFSFISVLIIFFPPANYRNVATSANMPGNFDYYKLIFFIVLLLIGISYFLFGILYYKIRADKFRINLILGTLAFCWGLIVIKIGFLHHGFLNDYYSYEQGIQYGPLIFSIIAVIIIMVPFSIPLFIISRMIKMQKLLNQ